MFLVTLTASIWARADNQLCNDAYEQGQILKRDTKLLEARDQFRTCVKACLLDAKKRSCIDWLAQTEHDVLTVVISAKDCGGTSLADIAVTMDGKPLAAKLDEGRSTSIPGRCF